MPQNEYIERAQKLYGKRLDHDERARKKQAREQGRSTAQEVRGLKAKLMHEARRKEKIQLKKRLRQHEERNVKSNDGPASSEPLPPYLLDRKDPSTAKALSSSIKDRRKEQSARFSVPLPKVKGLSEENIFSVVKTGKKVHKKAWKRVITKPTFVGEGFTRQAVKHERFIRPMGLRQRFAHCSHPELGITVKLPILGVKKNPQDALYTRLGVLTKGTIIEVNVSEMGMTTASGKVAWGRYAQITNDPENDGTVNAVLLV